MSEHCLESLKREMTKLSLATEWEDVKKEWSLVEMVWDDEWTNCLCHVEIKERCHMHNHVTGRECIIGNVCIKRFKGIDLHRAFDCIKKMCENMYTAPNADLLLYASVKRIITEWDYRFALDTKNKRNLSAIQCGHRYRINRRILMSVCGAALAQKAADSEATRKAYAESSERHERARVRRYYASLEWGN